MQTDNPYAAPSALVGSDDALALPIHTAGRWRRLFNWAIDKVVILALWFVAVVLLVMAGADETVDWLENLNRWQEYLVSFPVVVLYYGVMEGLFGVTIGKLCTGTRVVDEHGRPVRLRTAFLRGLCRYIPFDAFSVLANNDSTVRAWHDSVPRTYVVMKRAPVAAIATTDA
jgi:uncharacterized RDD family membrane protein YckC